MPEYLIPLITGENRIVKGKPVPIRGFEGCEFFVHRSLAEKSARPDRAWVFTELRTGAAVAYGKTPAAAISTGIYRLFVHGKTPKRLLWKYIETYLEKRVAEAMKGELPSP